MKKYKIQRRQNRKKKKKKKRRRNKQRKVMFGSNLLLKEKYTTVGKHIVKSHHKNQYLMCVGV